MHLGAYIFGSYNPLEKLHGVLSLKDNEKELRKLVDLVIQKVDLMNKKEDISFEILHTRLNQIEKRLREIEEELEYETK